MENIYRESIDLVERLFKSSDPKLQHFIYGDRSSIKISAPQVFIDILIQGHKEIFGIYPERSPEGKIYYRNIEVIPNYMMEIVLFHKDFPKLLQPWMFERIILNSKPNIASCRN